MERYFVVENKNIGQVGKPEFLETILFTGTKEECIAYEHEKRKEYIDRSIIDCFIQSESERNYIIRFNDFWNNLSEDEKRETIIVNGKKYNKAVYDFHNKKECENE